MSNMTDTDIDRIAQRVADKMSVHTCSVGLTHDDAKELKEWLGAIHSSKAKVGAALINLLVYGATVLLLLGFIAWLRDRTN